MSLGRGLLIYFVLEEDIPFLFHQEEACSIKLLSLTVR